MSPIRIDSRLLNPAWRHKEQRGMAAVEFGLLLPFLVMLLLGCADGAYCLLVNQRVDRIAYTVADLTTQLTPVITPPNTTAALTTADLDSVLIAAGQLMLPFTFNANGIVVISSVYNNPTTSHTTILWQYSGAGTYNCGGTSFCTSRIGSVGQTPTLPNNMALNSGDNMIVAEVFYQFVPLFVNEGLFSSNTIYRAVVYKPRLNALTASPT
jgi:Flp pilus assembly protein TadG